MKVAEHMNRNPVTVRLQDSLATARAKMRAGEFRQLPVVEDGKLIGIITDRDIREHGNKTRITEVKTVMTKGLVTVTPVTSLEEATKTLLAHKVGGLPVCNGEKLVGIITTSDILHAFLDVMGASAKGVAYL